MGEKSCFKNPGVILAFLSISSPTYIEWYILLISKCVLNGATSLHCTSVPSHCDLSPESSLYPLTCLLVTYLASSNRVNSCQLDVAKPPSDPVTLQLKTYSSSHFTQRKQNHPSMLCQGTFETTGLQPHLLLSLFPYSGHWSSWCF